MGGDITEVVFFLSSFLGPAVFSFGDVYDGRAFPPKKSFQKIQKKEDLYYYLSSIKSRKVQFPL